MEMKSAGPVKVLIGFADSLSAPEVVWSLQSAGFQAIAFARAGSRPSLRYLRSSGVALDHSARAGRPPLSHRAQDSRCNRAALDGHASGRRVDLANTRGRPA